MIRVAERKKDMIENNAKNNLDLLLFGDKIKFIDKDFGELVGTVISRWNERKSNFYYSVSVKADRRGEKGEDEGDEEAKKYTYKLDKEKYSNAGYIFNVGVEDIIEVVKKHSSNVEKIEKSEKQNK